jgi:hypothetical protein
MNVHVVTAQCPYCKQRFLEYDLRKHVSSCMRVPATTQPKPRVSTPPPPPAFRGSGYDEPVPTSGVALLQGLLQKASQSAYVFSPTPSEASMGHAAADSIVTPPPHQRNLQGRAAGTPMGSPTPPPFLAAARQIGSAGRTGGRVEAPSRGTASHTQGESPIPLPLAAATAPPTPRTPPPSERQICTSCGKLALAVGHQCETGEDDDPFASSPTLKTEDEKTKSHQLQRPIMKGPCVHCGEIIDLRFIEFHLTKCIRKHLATTQWDPETKKNPPVVFKKQLTKEEEERALAEKEVEEIREREKKRKGLDGASGGSSSGGDTATLKDHRLLVKYPLPEEAHQTLRLCVLCQEVIAKADFFAHLDVCPQNLRSCPYCTRGVAVHQYDDHVHTCEGNTRECYICNKRVQVEHLPDHLQQCGSEGKIVTMFHGTSEANAKSILLHGFVPSTGGLLGAGVYLSRDVAKASNYGPAIVEAQVNVGRVAVINRKTHPLQKTWKVHGYDSAWIPANCGMVSSGLEEHCVFDPRRIAVVRITSAPTEKQTARWGNSPAPATSPLLATPLGKVLSSTGRTPPPTSSLSPTPRESVQALSNWSKSMLDVNRTPKRK